MIMFSKLRHFHLVDSEDHRSRLRDLTIDVLESDYPPIRQMLHRNANGREQLLPWSAVTRVDWQRSLIHIQTPGHDSPAETAVNEEVFLARDVVDALVIDLHNRRVTRANDLWLAEENGELVVKAADTSVRAIFRRLTRGRFHLIAGN